SVEHLSRPAMGDHPKLRDKGPYPLLEALKASFPVVGLAALVIFTADEQKIILALFARLDADVVIRIFCIPIERIGQRSVRQRKGDNIGSVRRGLGVQDNAIGDRGVCRDYGMTGTDDGAFGSQCHSAVFFLNVENWAMGEKTHSASHGSKGNARKIFKRMEC